MPTSLAAAIARAMLGVVAVLLALAFGGAWALGALLKLARADRITLLFAGAQKSLAVGALLAATLFPPAVAGMVLVPILVYHMAQRFCRRGSRRRSTGQIKCDA